MFQRLWYERTRSLKLKPTSDSWGFCERAARIKSTSWKLSERPPPRLASQRPVTGSGRERALLTTDPKACKHSAGKQ